MEPHSSDATPQASSPGVASPFSQASVMIQPSGQKQSRLSLWITIGVLALALIGLGVFWATQYVNDPYRTLEEFSVDKYLSNYRAVAGARFKAQLKVEADLGWRMEKGRILVLTQGSDPRPIVVLFPPKLSQIVFTKGQLYLIELQVAEGGLIYANSCKKL